MGELLCTLLGNWKLEWMGPPGYNDLERDRRAKNETQRSIYLWGRTGEDSVKKESIVRDVKRQSVIVLLLK